jgi:hypothetical protein
LRFCPEAGAATFTVEDPVATVVVALVVEAVAVASVGRFAAGVVIVVIDEKAISVFPDTVKASKLRHSPVYS